MTNKNTTKGQQNSQQSNLEAVEEPAVHRPSHEEIAKLAYSFWEERGGHNGLPDADWLRAERELRALGPQTPAR